MSRIDLGIEPLVSLIPVSILAGIGMLVVFRHASDQAAIRRSKNLVAAHLLEFRLFMDEPRLVLRAQRDLIVGYARGYRASWQTALGSSPEALVEDNKDAWMGDHCINAADVPGVLFSNRKLSAGDPRLKDVTVSILQLFGVGPGPGMSGRKIL